MNRPTKAQEEMAIFEHSFERIQKMFRLNGDAKEIKAYLFEHDLADFLVWVQQPIIDVFGDCRTELELQFDKEDNKTMLLLTVYPDMLLEEDQLMDLHDIFNDLIADYRSIDSVLKYLYFDLWGFNTPNYIW
ncbi:MAG: hypothetical protein WCL34_15250 [Methylococcaceae bacterium]